VVERCGTDVAELGHDTRLTELKNRQQKLLARLADIETRERSVLAEVIHDEPVQLIVAAILRVDSLARRLSAADGRELEAAAKLLELAVDKLRNLIVIALGPPDLTEGLGVALRDLAEGIFLGSTAFELVGGSHVNLTDAANGTAYRVFREALINIRQHARSQHVTLRLAEHNGMVEIMLIDDGMGSECLDAGRGHLGVATMRARADAEGGFLHVESAPGVGTTVMLSLPVKNVDAG
jgi:signal transduction histidine kinase